MKKYRLFGYINMFGITPDFVYPVYVLDEEYYFAHGDKFLITDFIKIKNSYINRIQILPEWYGQINRTMGDDHIYIYQYVNEEISMGTGRCLAKHLENLETNHVVLQQRLEEFKTDFLNEKELKSKAVYYGTGRRKKAIARVFLSSGSGQIVINKKSVNEYFTMKYLKESILSPLKLTGTENLVDVYITVKGGGISGQAGAIRHGISRALINLDTDSKKILKAEGYLTRDPRMKERKKYGLKGARRSPQMSKR